MQQEPGIADDSRSWICRTLKTHRLMKTFVTGRLSKIYQEGLHP